MIMAIGTIRNGIGYDASNYHEYLIDSVDDVANLPTGCALGSIAYTADFSVIAVKKNDGTWYVNVN
jgi:hypothetical protein